MTPRPVFERLRRWVERNPLQTAAVALLLGAITTLSFAPFNYWFLSPLTAAAMFALFFAAPQKRAALFGFCFGIGLFLSGTYWIYVSVHVFGQAPLVIALALMFGLVLIMAGYLGFVGWAVSRLTADRPWMLALVGPALWALVEWLRGWALSGFPWLSFGYGQIESPLSGWAPVLGVYGVSWMLLVSAAALLPLVVLRGATPQALVLLVMPWATGALLQQETWTEELGSPIRTTIVQGGVPQDRKWLREQFAPTLNLYRDALLEAADSDLVVWPEVAIPAVSNQVESYLELLEGDIRQRRQTLALGILEPHGNGEQVYNSVLMLDGDNRQTYRKRHLVPFGEYFPVPDLVREWLRLLALPNTDMRAGDAVQPLLTTAGGLPVAAAICYEDAYGAEQLYGRRCDCECQQRCLVRELHSAASASAGCAHARAGGGSPGYPRDQQRHQRLYRLPRRYRRHRPTVRVGGSDAPGSAASRSDPVCRRRQLAITGYPGGNSHTLVDSSRSSAERIAEISQLIDRKNS